MLLKITTSESSMMSMSGRDVTNPVGAAGQKVNLSFEALCNAANSELQIIGQSEPPNSLVIAAARPEISPPILTARAVVPMIANIGLPCIMGGLTTTSAVSGNTDANAAQIIPFIPGSAVALTSSYPISHCYVSTNSSLHSPSVSNLLVSRSISLPGNPRQLILTPPVTIETPLRPSKSEDIPSVSAPVSPLQRHRKIASEGGATPARHICKYCGRGCAKPSVLQKHIRTHTGERPYPCLSCDLRFKTRSNLYKHCKSRTHQHSVTSTNTTAVNNINKSLSAEAVPVPASVLQLSGTGEVGSQQASPARIADDIAHISKTVECDSPKISGTRDSAPELSSIHIDADDVVTSHPNQSTTVATETISAGSVAVTNDSLSVAAEREPPTMQLSAELSTATSEPTEPASASKLDLHNVTPEAVQDHISRLISQNASIINMPMAEAPRPKRILRQSSDVVGNQTTKSGLSKQLLRTRSLNPPDKISTPDLQDTITDPSRPSAPTVSSEKLITPVTAAPVPTKSSPEITPKKRFLTVPGENPSMEIGSRFVKSLSTTNSQVTDAEHLPDACSSNIRIVLQLCDPNADDVSSNPSEALSPPSTKDNWGADSSLLVSRCPSLQTNNRVLMSSSAAVQPLSVSPGMLPTVCILKPLMEPTPTSSNCVSSPVIAPGSFQYVVGPSDATKAGAATAGKMAIAVTRSSSSPSQAVTMNNTPPRRGRPKGSKNRPKLAASSSDPQVRSNVNTAVTADGCVTTTPHASPAWKVKLNELLTKRSLSSERSLSCDRTALACDKNSELLSLSRSNGEPVTTSQPVISVPAPITVEKLPESTAPTEVSLLPAVCSSSATIPDNTPIVHVRSLSCDSSIPLKKRRKTLTELGRGTAFGTRVEDMVVSNEAASTEAAVCVEVLTNPVEFEAPETRYRTSSSSEPMNMASSDFDGLASKIAAAMQTPGNVSPLDCSVRSSFVDLSILKSIEPRTIEFIQSDVVLTPPPGVAQQMRTAFADSRVSSETDNNEVMHKDSNEKIATLGKSFDSSYRTNVDPVLPNTAAGLVCNLLPNVTKNSNFISENESTGSVKTTELRNDEAADGAKSMEVYETENGTSQASCALLLLSHAYPSLSLGAKPTFCSVIASQSVDAEFGSSDIQLPTVRNVITRPGGDVSCAVNKLSSQISASYRTVRPGTDKKLSDIVTHSSSWNIRKDQPGLVPAAGLDDSRRLEDNPQTSGSVLNLSIDPVVSSSFVPNVAGNIELHSRQRAPVNLPCLSSKVAVAKAQSAESAIGKRTWVCPGGYRSSESYVYVRGRGKGSYVCATCGVRCKKPSILRKHVHLHSDIRPHHCNVCDLGFKTKGNLSKHLNSKVHHLRSRSASSDQALEAAPDLADAGPSESVDSDNRVENEVDSSVVLRRSAGSSVDTEADSGCELQHGSSCETDPDKGNSCAADPAVLNSQSKSDLRSHDNRQEDDIDKMKLVEHGRSTGDTDTPAWLINVSVNKHWKMTADVTSSCDVTSALSSAPSAGVQHSKVQSSAETVQMPQSQTTGQTGEPGSLLSIVTESSVFGPARTDGKARYDYPPFRPASIKLHSNAIRSMTKTFEHVDADIEPVGNSRDDDDKAEQTDSNVLKGIEIVQSTAIETSLLTKSADSSSSPTANDSSRFNLKTASKLSRLNAVDFSAFATPAVDDSSTAERVDVSEESASVSSAVGSAATTSSVRVKPSTTKRCEIYPVPGRVNTEGVRVGTSYACPICRKQFSSAPRLALHRNIHYFERPTRCPTCRALFATRTMLDRHRQAEHRDDGQVPLASNPRPYKCEECGIAFRIHGHLAKHKRSKSHAACVEFLREPHDVVTNMNATGISDTVVNLTVNSGNGASVLDASISESSIEPPAFRDGSSGSDPEESRDSAQAARSPNPEVGMAASLAEHACDFCGELSADLTSFKKHLMSHFERRSYVCEHCDAGFTSAYQLAEHKKIHVQACAHVCGVCGSKADHKAE